MSYKITPISKFCDGNDEYKKYVNNGNVLVSIEINGNLYFKNKFNMIYDYKTKTFIGSYDEKNNSIFFHGYNNGNDYIDSMV